MTGHVFPTARLIRIVSFALLVGLIASSVGRAADFRRLPMKTYRDKMTAAWIGQMAGVGWGAPTEFKYNGKIIPEDKVPVWKPAMVNQFRQDDIYVEMTFLRSLEQHGFDVPMRQAGIDFANSGYPLWHANRAGRDNLRAGIAPPDSGHPKFNKHADDIDYQIEADFAGIIAPGMPGIVIELGEKFGRLMNYGDGLYGGQFVGGMYAEAYFEDDPVKLVAAGLKCIPEGSQYAEMVRDLMAWYREDPQDWQKTWQKIEDKYNLNPAYRRASCNGTDPGFNIDAKINGAYIVMGLLYGHRDPDQTIIISTRCGQDSDCNPSSAAGVLFTTLGASRLPERYTAELDRDEVFSHTAYSFSKLVEVCEALTRQAVKRAGGHSERTPEGEMLVLPVKDVKPSKLEQCWEPGRVANSRFTDEEREKITARDKE
ncbi:MAG: ADP-ribosylglycohydrolase family protein [Thermoguttaceae bacterium]|nr:ADP-ribosylglycohydrolase family protein [Thermoguttaceae bacterium]